MSSKSILTRTILRTSGIFGGTQGVAMIGSVLRTKLVAVWVGEAGIGLFGMMNAAVDLIGAFSTIGIRSSSVRDVAQADETGDKRLVGKMATAVRRWGWLLGIAGAIAMLAFSPIFAETTLGDRDAVWPFFILSLAVFLNSAGEAEKAVLQGLKMYSPLARASLWGVVGGCVVSIPIIYVWRIDSVAPVITAYAVITFLATWFLRARTERVRPRMTLRESFEAGRQFAKLGLYMTMSSAFGWLVGYGFMAYLNAAVGADKMGTYQAGYTLAVKYSGYLLSAFAMEYYPRLASACTRGERRAGVFMRHEMLLLCGIFVVGSIVLSSGAPLIVALFYSSDFVETVDMVILAAPMLVVRAVSWCGAFVILAKGDGPSYLLCESLSVVVGLVCNVAGFMLFGIAGIGASYVVWYVIYLLIITTILKQRYGIGIGRKVALRVGWTTTAAVAVSMISYLLRYLA